MLSGKFARPGQAGEYRQVPSKADEHNRARGSFGGFAIAPDQQRCHGISQEASGDNAEGRGRDANLTGVRQAGRLKPGRESAAHDRPTHERCRTAG